MLHKKIVGQSSLKHIKMYMEIRILQFFLIVTHYVDKIMSISVNKHILRDFLSRSANACA